MRQGNLLHSLDGLHHLGAQLLTHQSACWQRGGGREQVEIALSRGDEAKYRLVLPVEEAVPFEGARQLGALNPRLLFGVQEGEPGQSGGPLERLDDPRGQVVDDTEESHR